MEQQQQPQHVQQPVIVMYANNHLNRLVHQCQNASTNVMKLRNRDVIIAHKMGCAPFYLIKKANRLDWSKDMPMDTSWVRNVLGHEIDRLPIYTENIINLCNSDSDQSPKKTKPNLQRQETDEEMALRLQREWDDEDKQQQIIEERQNYQLALQQYFEEQRQFNNESNDVNKTYHVFDSKTLKALWPPCFGWQLEYGVAKLLPFGRIRWTCFNVFHHPQVEFKAARRAGSRPLPKTSCGNRKVAVAMGKPAHLTPKQPT